MSKPILCLDFDGVVHRYSKGWQDGMIYDPLTDGFIVWAAKARQYFRLAIFGSRSENEATRSTMREYLTRELDHEQEVVPPVTINDFEFPSTKPPAFLTIDDRAVRFRGDWSVMDPQTLRRFKTWTQESDRERKVMVFRDQIERAPINVVGQEIMRLVDLIEELVTDQPLHRDLAEKVEETLAPYRLPLD